MLLIQSLLSPAAAMWGSELEPTSFRRKTPLLCSSLLRRLSQAEEVSLVQQRRLRSYVCHLITWTEWTPLVRRQSDRK